MHLIFIGAGADPETSAEMYPAFADAVKVFREAYTTYTIKTIVKKNQVMDEAELLHSFSRDYISLVSQSDIKAVVPKDTDISDYRIELSPIEKIMAPVKPGDNLGTFEIYHEQDLVAIGTLTTDETIAKITSIIKSKSP